MQDHQIMHARARDKRMVLHLSDVVHVGSVCAVYRARAAAIAIVEEH